MTGPIAGKALGGIEQVVHHGLPAVRLDAPDGASALITRYGAQVLSWVPRKGGEQLFLSSRAEYADGKAIRGGVPVIFPQFGTEGPLPRHGFARTSLWRLLDSNIADGATTATFALSDSAATRALWPHAFACELTVSVGARRLDLELAVENPGIAVLRFTAALHSYLRVEAIDAVRVVGLQRTRYRDQVSGRTGEMERSEALAIGGEIDRVYLGVPRALAVHELRRTVAITASGFPDVVVWNPGKEKCAALADMAPEGYRSMLCVEAAAVGTSVNVEPGESWVGRQTFELE